MLRPTLTRALSILMVLLLPAATMLAESNAAMLYTQGSASINGGRVSSSGAVFAGDKVQTAADSSATLATRGTTVTLPANTQVVFGQNSLRLQSGTVVISTLSGMEGEILGLKVSPAAGQKAKFQLISEAGVGRVVALEGSLAVSDGKSMTLLQPGQVLTAQRDGKAPAQLPAVRNSLGSDAALIIVVSLAVAAGVAVGVANALQNESPTVP